MESATRARSRIPLVAAAILFAPAVGAGVFVGRSIPERQSPAIATSTGSSSHSSTRQARTALASCQEKIAAQSKPATASLRAEAATEGANEDAGRAPTTMEELETELRRCTKSELVVSAEVCSAAARQFEALMALPKDGQMCGPKSRAADLVEENFERCAAVANIAASVRPDDLTKDQSTVIAEAMRVHQTLTENELLRQLKDFVYTCTDVTPVRPPGLRTGPPKRPSGLRELPERKGVDR